MAITIQHKNEQPLLKRTAVVARMTFEKATPAYTEVAKHLASALKTSEDAIAVQHIYTDFGKREADVHAHVYASAKDKETIEPKPKQKKEKKKATAPAK